MKLYFFMLCALLGASGVFAQVNDNLQRVAPPENAKEIVKQMESTQVEVKPEGVSVDLSQQTSVTVVRNADLPYEQRKLIRKHKDLKTGAESRKVITRKEYDAERFGNTTGTTIETERAKKQQDTH